MTVQIRVPDIHAGQKWYATFLHRGPDEIPHEGLLSWQLLSACWLQVAQGTPATESGPLRLGVTDLEAERKRLMQLLGIEYFEIHQRQETYVKWATFNDPWGNQIGLFEYMQPTEKYIRMKRIVGQ
jgi:hypothetical protein